MAIDNSSPVDKKAIVAELKKRKLEIEALMPHINTAHQAFGTFDDQQKQASELLDKINRALAAYSA